MNHASLVAAFAITSTAFGQCATWSAGFGSPGPGVVYAVQNFDDGSGSGPRLHAAGVLSQAGAWLARRTADSWEPIGGVLNDEVRALATFTVGGSEKLVVGGRFTTTAGVPNAGVALWDGSTWSSVGPGAPARVGALAVFDDGTGAQLYASSFFEGSGGTMARWDGTTWVSVPLPASFFPFCMRVLDLGAGPRLVTGGYFFSGTQRGGVFERALHGGAWTQVGPRMTTVVNALELHVDGGAPKLHVGTDAGADAVVVWRFDAGAWTPLLQLFGPGTASGSSFGVRALKSFADADGSRLYAAGNLPYSTTALQQHHIVAWDGTQWSKLGAGQYDGVDLPVFTLALDDPAGPEPEHLVVGGVFDRVGERASTGIATWRDGEWTPAETGSGLPHRVRKLCVVRGPSGDELVASGDFVTAGTVPAEFIAAFDGTTWRSLQGPGGPTAAAQALGTWTHNGVEQLYAGFSATPFRVSRWDEGVWTPLGPALDNAVMGFTRHDFGAGEELVAYGFFTNLVAGSPRIARWDGSSWRGIGNGLPLASRVVADWQGELIAASGAALLRWDGASWSTFASLVGEPRAMCTFDDGGGPALFVAGGLQAAQGVPVNRIARFDGIVWTDAGGGSFLSTVTLESLQVFDAGDGPALYAGGPFTAVGGVTSGGIARWNGSTWSAVDGGILNVGFADSGVLGMAVYDDGEGPALFAGGTFSRAGAQRANNLARLACDAANGETYCAGDSIDALVTTACPCGNFGAAGRGCANSASAAGARLTAHGAVFVDPSTGTDTIVLVCSEMPASATAIFLCGDASTDTGLVFGDGVRCVDGNLIRLGTRSASSGVAEYPSPGGVSLSQRSQMPPGSGLVGSYQTYYRNASATFCPPATFNVSNGRRIVW